MSGLEWATNDLFDPTRLNKKTRFVGTGEQANTFITSPQVGQQVWPLEDYSTTFKHDKIHIRNVANDTWLNATVDEQAEGSIGTSSGAQQRSLSGDRKYCRDTSYVLPTTEKFYIISAIEAKWGQPGSEVMMAGVDIGTFSTNTMRTLLVALTPAKAYSTGVTKMKCMSRVLRGGTTLYPWASGTGSSNINAEANAGSTYHESTGAHTETPDYAHTDLAMANTGNVGVLKIYYYGYS